MEAIPAPPQQEEEEEEEAEEAAMPNKEHQEDEEEQEDINIGTILRYLVQDAESPVTSDNVVLGPDIISGLGEHINTEGYGPCPSTSGGHPFVSTPALTALGMPDTPAPHLREPTFTNLHRSLQQRVGAAGMRHVLNPNVSWETLIDESRGNPVSSEDKAKGIVCTVKPTCSSCVDLLNITVSDTDSDISILMFAVPKSDPTNPRMILDCKPFPKFTNSPKFK